MGLSDEHIAVPKMKIIFFALAWYNCPSQNTPPRTYRPFSSHSVLHILTNNQNTHLWRVHKWQLTLITTDELTVLFISRPVSNLQKLFICLLQSFFSLTFFWIVSLAGFIFGWQYTVPTSYCDTFSYISRAQYIFLKIKYVNEKDFCTVIKSYWSQGITSTFNWISAKITKYLPFQFFDKTNCVIQFISMAT